MSWRTKLEKLLCLKYLGSKSLAKTVGFQTMNVVPVSFHEITSLVAISSTRWYVLVRNGVGVDLWDSPLCSTDGAMLEELVYGDSSRRFTKKYKREWWRKKIEMERIDMYWWRGEKELCYVFFFIAKLRSHVEIDYRIFR